MNDLCADIGYKSINHYGEQLCGDHVDIVEQGDNSTVIVLADGLGSGVKASILSTLTSRSRPARSDRSETSASGKARWARRTVSAPKAASVSRSSSPGFFSHWGAVAKRRLISCSPSAPPSKASRGSYGRLLTWRTLALGMEGRLAQIRSGGLGCSGSILTAINSI